MTAADLLTRARADGLTLAMEPPARLLLRGDPGAVATWAPRLRPHKAALLELLTRADPLPDPPGPDGDSSAPPIWHGLHGTTLADGAIGADQSMQGHANRPCLSSPDTDRTPVPTGSVQALSAIDLENAQEAIEERASIREFEAGETRQVAETRARSSMRVYRLRIAMGPGEAPRWVTMLAPGCDLVEARRAAAWQFGPERVIEVLEHRPGKRGAA